jgi:hypothetical protein
MSTSGSLGAASFVADVVVGADAHWAIIPAATNAVQTVTASGNATGLTAYNNSDVTVKGSITFDAAATVIGDRTFVLLPQSVFSGNWENNVNVKGLVKSIDFVVLSNPTATGPVSAIAAATAPLLADGRVLTNFISV